MYRDQRISHHSRTVCAYTQTFSSPLISPIAPIHFHLHFWSTLYIRVTRSFRRLSKMPLDLDKFRFALVVWKSSIFHATHWSFHPPVAPWPPPPLLIVALLPAVENSFSQGKCQMMFAAYAENGSLVRRWLWRNEVAAPFIDGRAIT